MYCKFCSICNSTNSNLGQSVVQRANFGRRLFQGLTSVTDCGRIRSDCSLSNLRIGYIAGSEFLHRDIVSNNSLNKDCISTFLS